jgi:peptidoglycan/xylan/chitin deacetylase (PgdA/CDA1 family)
MKDECRGIVFHGIGMPGRPLERGEDRYWISEDRFRRCLDVVASMPDPSSVHISFDDGNASDRDIALPALVERGLKADFFVLTGRIGQPGSLGADGLRALRGAGMGVGSHGINHLNWREIPADVLLAELEGSRSALAQHCGDGIDRASVPFGRYNGRVVAAVRAAGYQCLATNDGGPFVRGAFLVPRTNMRVDMPDQDFRDLITGNERLSRRVRRFAGRVRRRFV